MASCHGLTSRLSRRTVVRSVAGVAGSLALGIHREQVVAQQQVATPSPRVIVTETLQSTTRLGIPPGNVVRTVTQLSVPPGAHWDTHVSGGSLLLTMESGVLRLTLTRGVARVASAPASGLSSTTLHQVTADQLLVLRAGDRLVLHDHGSLVVQNIGQSTVVARLIRVV